MSGPHRGRVSAASPRPCWSSVAMGTRLVASPPDCDALCRRGPAFSVVPTSLPASDVGVGGESTACQLEEPTGAPFGGRFSVRRFGTITNQTRQSGERCAESHNAKDGARNEHTRKTESPSDSAQPCQLQLDRYRDGDGDGDRDRDRDLLQNVQASMRWVNRTD